jgi:hypothetical protein
LRFLRQYRKGVALVGALVVVSAVSAVAAQPANALLGLGNTCGSTMSQPFAQFGDNQSYTPVPGGTFESGAAGWTLKDGASVVSGNEPFAATGSHSLSLPAGSSATSPFMCVSTLSPTLRTFGFASSSATPLTVQVLSKNLFGVLTVLGVGIVYPGHTTWAPTSSGLFLQSLGALITNTTSVAFRFAPVNGAWTIDDAYVDPFLCK